ncbi:MAG: hypothetical protein H6807_16660 [Planctomycetes bacterium]|nr:hypothetical protein [Acidimicrobiales bacterium]MCB9834095.1 hypothetical protein [Planctomycetota bacterium]
MNGRTAALLLVLLAPLAAQEQAVELGRIGWARDLAALAAGDRPGLLLFQEVPG